MAKHNKSINAKTWYWRAHEQRSIACISEYRRSQWAGSKLWAVVNASRRHGCGTRSWERYLLTPMTEGIKERMVLSVAPTPTRFPTKMLRTMSNLLLVISPTALCLNNNNNEWHSCREEWKTHRKPTNLASRCLSTDARKLIIANLGYAHEHQSIAHFACTLISQSEQCNFILIKK